MVHLMPCQLFPLRPRKRVQMTFTSSNHRPAVTVTRGAVILPPLPQRRRRNTTTNTPISSGTKFLQTHEVWVQTVKVPSLELFSTHNVICLMLGSPANGEYPLRSATDHKDVLLERQCISKDVNVSLLQRDVSATTTRRLSLGHLLLQHAFKNKQD